MRKVLLAWSSHVWTCCGLFLFGIISGTSAEPTPPAFLELTNVLQLRQSGAPDSPAGYHIQLEGNVWWADSAASRLVLQDAFGVAELEMDLAGQPVAAGQRVRISGNGVITKSGAGFKLGIKGPAVDNNGIHTMIEKSGRVYLDAGRQPLRVDWFNGVGEYGLEVDYAGPDMVRQKIPEAALFRMQLDTAVGTTNWVNGLDYKCYEVAGEVLPGLHSLPIIKAGTTTNFDLGIIPRKTHVGLQFTGFLEVPRAGLYTFYTKSDDGSQLFVGGPTLNVEAAGRAEFPPPRRIALGQILPDDAGGEWVQVEGTVTFANVQTNGMKLELSSGTGRIGLEIADVSGLSPQNLLNHRIRATGVCQSAYTADGQKIAGILLVPGANEIQRLETNRAGAEKLSSTNLSRLTSAAEVHQLKREEAERGYPVEIQGVVTCVLPERQAFTLQDATRGIYVVDQTTNRPFLPQTGEFLRIEGVTDPSLFAPIVNAQNVESRGVGRLPEPLRPTWDQLINGSLDAQYVELQGVITAVNSNGITLLTRDDRIRLELRGDGLTPEALAQDEGALVRVRGSLFASWDYVTHEVKLGEVRIYGADISVDQPPPADLFAVPGKTASELFLFDPKANGFQRVKVAGQIIHVRDTECFMTDGKNGLRFITKQPVELQPGDLVEAVGFPELRGASPLLREAVVRQTGHAPLPPAKMLASDNLIQSDYDATQVKLTGVLAGIRNTPAEQILEIHNGLRTFVARLNGKNEGLDSLPPGSQLELTGTYSGSGGNKAVGQDISTFELLLNSPADIKVLARPPWWTLERLLTGMGALACVLVITVLWITQLHRKVEERTRQLTAQIRERQIVEQQRAMAQERARVAQDLHDELGSGLTEISMLVAVAGSTAGQRKGPHLEQIDDRARQMVLALDEIVWAINPKHDLLASLVSYSCLYADRFLKLAGIRCQLKGAVDMPERTVNPVHRHELFLAFKEALTNVVRHSGAAEVRLGFQLIGDRLRLSIADNGGGLGTENSKQGSDGLNNMRVRVEKMGGRFAITSEPGRGTTLRFYVPLN